MTHRERLINTLSFKQVDRLPDWEFGIWEQTITRWHKEGLPEEYTGIWDAIADYFETDDKMKLKMNIECGLVPQFEVKTLEEKGDHIIFQDEDGAICEMMNPKYGASIPKYLRFAIETKEDWIKLRDEKLNPDSLERLPSNIDEICVESLNSDLPVFLKCGSLYGWLRNWMGVENFSYAVYDEPEWVEEMMEYLTCLKLIIYSKIAGKAKIDVGEWWEDMCYKDGSLLAPNFFRKWMLPRYKRTTEYLKKEFDCHFNLLDCDGKINELIPLWLEGGINVLYPIEASHTDIYNISQFFDKKLAVAGNFNKMALIEGKNAIDREFERIMPIIKNGGYIPHTDHLVPPDVSFENYCYYRKRKCEIIGKRNISPA